MNNEVKEFIFDNGMKAHYVEVERGGKLYAIMDFGEFLQAAGIEDKQEFFAAAKILNNLNLATITVNGHKVGTK